MNASINVDMNANFNVDMNAGYRSPPKNEYYQTGEKTIEMPSDLSIGSI